MAQTASLFVLGSFVVACSAKVAHLPRPGESARAEAFTVEPGGKGLNLALGAHRLGAKVDGIFAIGNDFFSHLAVSAFEQAGLSSTMLRRLGSTTGSGIGFTDETGENCLAVFPGANLLLSPREVQSVAQSIQAADLVLAQFEIGDEPIHEAFALARAAGCRTLLNPSPYRPIMPEVLQNTSILVLNRVEAGQIGQSLGMRTEGEGTGSYLEQLASTLLVRGPELLIVTLGRDGAMALRNKEPPLYQSAFTVEAVDSLGAGDAFTAGLATSLLERRSLEQCLRRASGCGAIVSTRIGVFEGLPNARELDRFLTSRST